MNQLVQMATSYHHVLYSGAKTTFNHGLITYQVTGDLKSLIMAGLPMKLAYSGFKNYSFQPLLHTQRANITC